MSHSRHLQVVDMRPDREDLTFDCVIETLALLCTETKSGVDVWVTLPQLHSLLNDPAALRRYDGGSAPAAATIKTELTFASYFGQARVRCMSPEV